MFENSSDLIGNRLALTLGIFALIFSLPTIIDSMKPQTSSPTIADSLLSLIIIVTIAFTISSSMSISSTGLAKHYALIDGIVLIIVSGMVIIYFGNFIRDPSLWWLVSVLIVGLGYGLLLRVLGMRVTVSIVDLFRSSRITHTNDTKI